MMSILYEAFKYKSGTDVDGSIIELMQRSNNRSAYAVVQFPGYDPDNNVRCMIAGPVISKFNYYTLPVDMITIIGAISLYRDNVDCKSFDEIKREMEDGFPEYYMQRTQLKKIKQGMDWLFSPSKTSKEEAMKTTIVVSFILIIVFGIARIS